MGYLTSYIMIGCVFTAAVALWDDKNKSLFWFTTDRECDTLCDEKRMSFEKQTDDPVARQHIIAEHVQKAKLDLEVRRVTYMATQMNKKDECVLCSLAILLDKFKRDTMERI